MVKRGRLRHYTQSLFRKIEGGRAIYRLAAKNGSLPCRTQYGKAPADRDYIELRQRIAGLGSDVRFKLRDRLSFDSLYPLY